MSDIHRGLDAGSLSCVGVVTAYLERIRAYEDGGPRLNAITTVNPRALDAAAALDAQRQAAAGRSPQHCIPGLLKNNIDTADMPTSNGSVILKEPSRARMRRSSGR